MSTEATLLDPIRARARMAPDWPGIVLVHPDGRREPITAAALWSEVVAAANGLRAAGLRPNDVAIIVLDHSRQLIATFLGAMAAGIVPSLAAPPAPRLDPAIYRARIRALAATAGAAALVTRGTETLPWRDALAGLPCSFVDADTLQGAVDEDALPPLSSEQLAFIQYSSGSGGTQKGVAHTHRGVLRYIESKRRGVFTSDDVVVCWTPLYHDQGLLSGLLAPAVVGFRSVLISPFHWVRQPGIMPNFALNHSVRAVRDGDVQNLDLRRWKLLLLGGEPVREQSLQAFAARFAALGFRAESLRAGYGMAEMVEGVTAGHRGPPHVDWVNVTALQNEARAETAPPGAPGSMSFVSCGVAKDGAELRIVDGDGALLAERRVGEIEVRCEYRMREYYRRPDLTAAAFRDDGWFRSRDLGYVADGELYVVGRMSDLIIVGGRKIAAEDVEAVAERLPQIANGRSVAFGVADERAGTERLVVVCESATPDDTEQRFSVERDLRRALTQELDATLGELRLVERGWIVKTSSGKKARRSNRDKYRASAAPESP